MQLIGSCPPGREVLRVIGSGGMGVVYEAFDRELKRRVALKVLHPHLTNREEMRDKLLEEARLAARVEHEHVVRIYSILACDSDICLEMQYVEGVPLAELIEAQPFSPEHALDLTVQTLEALAACHGQGVVHGDLKPGNLLVTPEGKVMLTDFGIAHATFQTPKGVTFPTSSLPMWGTPQYCPPEAWNGSTPSPAWDLYALGVLVTEAVAGCSYFQAVTPAMLMRQKLEGWNRPVRELCPQLSTEFAALLDALKAFRPEDRPVTSQAALAMLHEARGPVGVRVNTSPLQHNRKQVKDQIQPLSVPRALLHDEPRQPGKKIKPIVRVPLLAAIVFAASIASVFLYLGEAPRGESRSDYGTSKVVATVGKPGEIRDLFVHYRTAFFSYDDGRRGRELWKLDASGLPSMLADINPGIGSSNPSDFLARPQGGFFFVASTPAEGTEPWYCDTSRPHTTRKICDTISGPMHGNPYAVAAWDRLIYFSATSLNEGDQFWISDTHENRTGPLTDVNQEVRALGDRGTKYFVDSDGICFLRDGDKSTQLLRYQFRDGKVAKLADVQKDVRDLAILGETFVFTMTGPEIGFELWKTRSGNERPELVKDIWPGEPSGDPQDFYVWNDAIYFRAISPGYGYELWKTDGTPDGTVRLTDTFPGPGDGSPAKMLGIGGLVFFRARSDINGIELWVTDGTPEFGARVFDIWPGQDSSHPYSILPIGNYLFFTANDGAFGEELWSLNLQRLDQSPALVQDLWPGSESSEPHSLRLLHDAEGVFVYKTRIGNALMRLQVDEDEVTLVPCRDLPLTLESNE